MVCCPRYPSALHPASIFVVVDVLFSYELKLPSEKDNDRVGLTVVPTSYVPVVVPLLESVHDGDSFFVALSNFVVIFFTSSPNVVSLGIVEPAGKAPHVIFVVISSPTLASRLSMSDTSCL